MDSGKKICKCGQFFPEQSGVSGIDGFKDDPVEGSTGTVFHHQQTIQLVIAPQNFGHIMIFAEILSEIAYIPVFPVESAPCKFPIPVPFGIKKFTDHILTCFPVFIDIYGIGTVGCKNPYPFRAVTAQLGENIIAQITEHGIGVRQMS
jgi:hypothetical protein